MKGSARDRSATKKEVLNMTPAVFNRIVVRVHADVNDGDPVACQKAVLVDTVDVTVAAARLLAVSSGPVV